MKKLLSLAAVLFAFTLVLTACGNPNGSGGNGSGNGNGEATSRYQVGDIVLNDGTYLRGVESVSSADIAKAIAVIYKVSGSAAYGVGLVHSTAGLQWCTSSAAAFNTNITTIQCPPNESGGNLTFNENCDTEGSDNLEQIAAFLGTSNDTETAENYPAFYFAKNYASQSGSHVSGTAYASGWYLPTLSELYDIWKVKATVEAASNLCGGSRFGSWYWSSSQCDSGDDMAYLILSGGSWNGFSKRNSSLCVCAIREFN